MYITSMGNSEDKLKELVSDVQNEGSDEAAGALLDLLSLIEKSANPVNEEPCDEGEDCSDVLSPCCNCALDMVFGSLPLEVTCIKCNKGYILRDLLQS